MIDLNYILTKFPWEEKYTKQGKPLDFFWEIELKVTREEIWPYIIDTSSFNQRMGMSKMNYIEKDGKLFGSAKQAGFKMEWEEVPWEWEYLKEMNNARIFSKGFGHYVRTKYILEPYGESRSKLYVYFGWIPRNFLMKKLLIYAMPKLEEDYFTTFAEIQKEIQRNTTSLQIGGNVASLKGFVADPEWNNEEKLDLVKPDLIKSGVKEDVIDSVFHWIRNTGDNDLDRIRIKYLTKLLKHDFDDLLLLFLYGSRLGIFTLSWDIVCPHCRGVRTSLQKLGDMPAKDECEVCDVEFETTGKNSIEVTFHIHPSVRKIEKQIYCAAEPNRKRHVLLSKSIPPGKAFSTELLIQPGVFRLRKQGESRYHLVDVDDKFESKDIIWLDKEVAQEMYVHTKPTLVFQNEETKPITIILEERKEDQTSLRPSELFNFPEFRDLFSEEAIATNLQLDIGLQTILFTDIVGSTKFYETEGDHGAFLQVREHFVKTYQIMKREKGVVVKTIGDAVMASFPAPVYAIRASKELQEWFHSENKHTPVRIRISMHYGSCLAVNLNSNIDYFGNTINYAAKMQSHTESGEISLSESVFRDQEVRKYFLDNGIKLKKLDFPLSWANRTDSIYIWKP
ncbi:adenylate/guanylate cyclase domain-containing protein [Leptospira ilyithenensis]|uniref:Adenylate/guanylate cyclase domain-containing protein n=1 Tax=Leptospira ilyithenensis TaxID=2484901 RepID=A0A4R9LW01_9LEPT|nr:adenylate/guanylate cyclase domain-containing protein [Leptospira ilyithenensis]TGN16794.1 adenylate/guanylate cyclase domain-containing protein [Leptospira ilyithenensis]